MTYGRSSSSVFSQRRFLVRKSGDAAQLSASNLFVGSVQPIRPYIIIPRKAMFIQRLLRNSLLNLDSWFTSIQPMIIAAFGRCDDFTMATTASTESPIESYFLNGSWCINGRVVRVRGWMFIEVEWLSGQR